MMTRSLSSWVILAVVVLLLPFGQALATSTHHHSASAHHHEGNTKTTSTVAYQRAMQAMHRTMQVPLSGNVDIDFVRQMIPHHEAALAMAKVQLTHGRDERLRKLARWIVTAQKREIAWMQHWRMRYDHGETLRGASDYYGAAMQKMHHDMMIAYTGNADIDFARGMIPHHQGALDMAAVWMERGVNPELKPLVTDIFTSQSQEIAWMQRWLAKQAD